MLVSVDYDVPNQDLHTGHTSPFQNREFVWVIDVNHLGLVNQGLDGGVELIDFVRFVRLS